MLCSSLFFEGQRSHDWISFYTVIHQRKLETLKRTSSGLSSGYCCHYKITIDLLSLPMASYMTWSDGTTNFGKFPWISCMIGLFELFIIFPWTQNCIQFNLLEEKIQGCLFCWLLDIITCHKSYSLVSFDEEKILWNFVHHVCNYFLILIQWKNFQEILQFYFRNTVLQQYFLTLTTTGKVSHWRASLPIGSSM